jgi:hypothetical protein
MHEATLASNAQTMKYIAIGVKSGTEATQTITQNKPLVW